MVIFNSYVKLPDGTMVYQKKLSDFSLSGKITEKTWLFRMETPGHSPKNSPQYPRLLERRTPGFRVFGDPWIEKQRGISIMNYPQNLWFKQQKLGFLSTNMVDLSTVTDSWQISWCFVLKPGIVSILQAGAPVRNRDWLVQIALITMVFVGDISIYSSWFISLITSNHYRCLLAIYRTCCHG